MYCWNSPIPYQWLIPLHTSHTHQDPPPFPFLSPSARKQTVSCLLNLNLLGVSFFIQLSSLSLFKVRSWFSGNIFSAYHFFTKTLTNEILLVAGALSMICPSRLWSRRSAFAAVPFLRISVFHIKDFARKLGCTLSTLDFSCLISTSTARAYSWSVHGYSWTTGRWESYKKLLFS